MISTCRQAPLQARVSPRFQPPRLAIPHVASHCGGHMQPAPPAMPPPGAATVPGVTDSQPVISWPGYGVMFFWQLGVLQHLEAVYDLKQCTMVGSSAGSLLSVLAACDVQPQAALDLAHALCQQHGVLQRPLGLLGVWGAIVREWLDALLPDDAAGRCSGRVCIILTTLPLLRHKAVSHFKDRRDLIDCCLASSHVPLLMDWRLTASYAGQRCMDGSLVYMLTRRCAGLTPAASLARLLLFDPWHDRQLCAGGLALWRTLLRCVAACGKQGAQELLELGRAHAAACDAAGRLRLLRPLHKAVGGAAGAGAAAAGAAAAAGMQHAKR